MLIHTGYIINTELEGAPFYQDLIADSGKVR